MINAGEIASNLNYDGSSIKKIEFETNIVSIGGDFPIHLELQCASKLRPVHDEKRVGRVLLNIKAHGEEQRESGDLHLTLNVEIEGEYSAAESVVSESDFIQMLQVNGTASLYSILRAHVASISASAFLNGKINLPMINVLELLKAPDDSGDTDATENKE